MVYSRHTIAANKVKHLQVEKSRLLIVCAVPMLFEKKTAIQTYYNSTLLELFLIIAAVKFPHQPLKCQESVHLSNPKMASNPKDPEASVKRDNSGLVISPLLQQVCLLLSARKICSMRKLYFITLVMQMK